MNPQSITHMPELEHQTDAMIADYIGTINDLRATIAKLQPAESIVPIKIKRELFRFKSLGEWINRAQLYFNNAGVRKIDYIAIDTAGNVCRCGKQFMDADKNNTYPVIVYELE